MNSNTQKSRTATSARRALPAFAIVTLAVGLAACQTPPQGSGELPVVHAVVVDQAPEVQLNRSVDRVTQAQLDTQRAEGLQREANLTQPPAVHLPTWTDRIKAQIEHDEQQPKVTVSTTPQRSTGIGRRAV